MHPDCSEILFTKEALEEKVKELAARLTDIYKGKDLVVIGLLKGSFVFLSDLVRYMDVDMNIEFMVASSYRGSTVSSGEVRISLDLRTDIKGKDVLIVEDILDTGNTLYFIRKLLLDRGPSSVKICALLDKPSRRTVDIKADYVGFTVENKFIIGYGLDYAERYRNLPYIGVLKPEIYE